LAVFEIGLFFMSRQAWTVVLQSVLPHTAEMTGVYHSAQTLVKMEVSLFAGAGFELRSSQSLARITGLSHCVQHKIKIIANNVFMVSKKSD
jgi:hypothetical protein